MTKLTTHYNGRPALWLALALLLVGLLLVAPAVASAQDDSPFGADVVTATTTANLNLRNAPNTDAEILATLPVGSVVGFTGFMDETGDWVQVDAADGPVGWVWADFLSNVPDGLNVRGAAAAPPATDTGDQPFGEDVVTTTTTANLNMRNAPNGFAEIIDNLPFGSVVGFTGLVDETGDWVQVDAADGPTGWVWADFLTDVPDDLTTLTPGGTPATDETAAADEEPFAPDVVTATTTANLNIRNRPTTDAELLDTLPFGTVVGFTGFTDETGNWVQVDAAGGPVGWVWDAYLSNVPDNLTALSPAGTVVQGPADATEEPFAPDVVTATTRANVYIRNAPGQDSDILATLPFGTIVGFTGLMDASGNWVQVDAAGGPVGWVWADLLSNVPDTLTVWTPGG